ncbi:MAG: class I SAM-dependent methyltransferase [Acidimicrobiales bacterium]
MKYDESRAAGYDTAHATRFAEAEAVVDALVALLPPGGGRALELGVGTGRLAIPLAARGVDVTGIDDSQPMLDRMGHKHGGDKVHPVNGDFTDVGTLVDGQFDLVFVAFNTLFELPDQDAQVRCVTGAARHLAGGGVLVVEAIAPDLTRLEQTVTALAVNERQAVLQATHHNPESQKVSGADVTIATDGSVRAAPWTIRYVSVPELDLMARLAGLRLRHRWGGWHREPFTASSPVHVSVYEK